MVQTHKTPCLLLPGPFTLLSLSTSVEGLSTSVAVVQTSRTLTGSPKYTTHYQTPHTTIKKPGEVNSCKNSAELLATLLIIRRYLELDFDHKSNQQIHTNILLTRDYSVFRISWNQCRRVVSSQIFTFYIQLTCQERKLVARYKSKFSYNNLPTCMILDTI